MTDEHPESPEIEAVRRLLADSRHTDPMPDDVAARLDRALADLRREPDHEDSASVVPLVSGRRQRRRRRAAGLLAAAAAIVVGGIVAAQNLPSTTNPPASGSAGSAAGGEASERSRADAAVPRAANGAVVIHPQRLAATALAARRELHRLKGKQLDAHLYDMAQAAACVGAPSHGHVVRAVYRRAPAALVYHRPVGGSQDVDLVVCGSSRPIRSVTLPAP